MVIDKLERLWILVVGLVVYLEEREMNMLFKDWVDGGYGCG